LQNQNSVKNSKGRLHKWAIQCNTGKQGGLSDFCWIYTISFRDGVYSKYFL